MTGRLNGKVAAITGGASGIGRAIAEAMHREGCRVVIGDVSGAEQDVAARLGEGAAGVRCDVTSSAEAAELMSTARARFGTLNVLVNCAGISPEPALTADVHEDDYDRVVGVNLKGVFLTTRAALPHFLELGGGSVVNIASVAALTAFPMQSVYTAAKGGVVSMTRCTALEYAIANIRVNAICPGVIDTPMLRGRAGDQVEAVLAAAAAAAPIDRVGLPDDIAPLAVYLASDESSFMTGAVLSVDGGFTAGNRSDATAAPWQR